MKEVALYDAKNALSRLVAEVEAGGETIVITRHGKPAAKLMPMNDDATLDDAVAAGKELLAMLDESPDETGDPPLTWEELKAMMRDEEEDEV